MFKVRRILWLWSSNSWRSIVFLVGTCREVGSNGVGCCCIGTGTGTGTGGTDSGERSLECVWTCNF